MTGILGVFAILGLAFAVSTDRKRALNPRILAWGLGLQVLIAVVVLRTPLGSRFFMAANNAATGQRYYVIP